MALINCQFCGHVVSTTAERCPSCGAPLTPEAHKPVETAPVFTENELHPQPEPVENNEVNFGVKKSHTGRYLWLITLIVLVLALVEIGSYYFYYLYL